MYCHPQKCNRWVLCSLLPVGVLIPGTWLHSQVCSRGRQAGLDLWSVFQMRWRCGVFFLQPHCTRRRFVSKISTASDTQHETSYSFDWLYFLLPGLLRYNWRMALSKFKAYSMEIWLISSVQSLSRVWLFATPWTAARQASLSITNSRSSLKLTSIESVIPSSHLILCRPLFLLPPIPPSIRVFSNESALHMRWPKYWSFSFSIIPSKEHSGLTPSEWTDWISLQSKGLSRVFSNTTVQKHQFFGAQLSSQSNSHIHTWPQEKP